GLAVTRGPDGPLTVRLAGAWSLEHGVRAAARVEEALAADPPPRALRFDTEALERWDSGVLAFIAKLDDLASRRKVEVDRKALPSALQRLLDLAGAVSEKQQGAQKPPRPASWISRLGTGALAAWASTLSALAFLGEVTFSFGRLFTRHARFRWGDLAVIVQECGAQALPIVTLINFLVGMIIAFVGAVQLKKFGASIYIADLVAIATARELSSLMTAVIMSGRTGSGFAAQLGTMQ